jgi:hypothetical protein
VEFAEELAVEFMDAHHGPRSGNFRSQQAAGEALNGCLHALVAEIAKAHQVSPQEVAKSFGQRSVLADIAINTPFFVAYIGLAAIGIRWLFRRYPPNEGWTGTIVMLVFASLALSAAGMLVGEQYSVLAESFRIGTGHLSYRLDRLPWVQHRAAFFMACFAVFWLAAVIGHRRLPKNNAG